MGPGHTVVWLAGTQWSSVPGTDKKLVTSLAAANTIVWVDPPKPGVATLLRGRGKPRITKVHPRIVRVEIAALPGVTRPVVRGVTSVQLWSGVRRVLAELALTPDAVVVAFPLAQFDPSLPGLKILYITDDWLAGAELMGFSRRRIRQILTKNLAACDAAAAVSPGIFVQLQKTGIDILPAHRQFIIPNGCDPMLERKEPAAALEIPKAVLVGQLNERLDMDVLETLAEANIPLLVAGPRKDKAPEFVRRMDAFLSSKSVHWLGGIDASSLKDVLTPGTVGLTPYADTAFNRSSFPLKTLEYLAAGLPVVSTDLPASRWLESEDVAVCTGPGLFTERTMELLGRSPDQEGRQRRRALARAHSWESRAVDFMSMLHTAHNLEHSTAEGLQ